MGKSEFIYVGKVRWGLRWNELLQALRHVLYAIRGYRMEVRKS